MTSRRFRELILALLSLLFFVGYAQAADLTSEQDARYRLLAQELRCLVCQNQSIADSNAPLAEDLREQVKAQIVAGKSDADITAYLTARYGDFVLYRPRMKSTTALLWLAPALLVLLGIIMAWRFSRRRAERQTKVVDQAALQRLLNTPDQQR